MTVVELEGQTGTSRSPERRVTVAKSLLYEDVIRLVEKLIDTQGLRPGDRLPTQAEIAKLAGVSLITVRRALDELERIGRVRRQQGLGTFVADSRIVAAPVRPGSLLGTMDPTEQRSRRIATAVVGLSVGQPSRDIAAALEIAADVEVWKLTRRRLRDSRPLILETSVIPVRLAPDLDAHEAFLKGSLYQLLADRYGLVDAYEEQLLDVIAPTREERQILRLSTRSQVVRLRGRSLDRRGVVFDCFEQLYPASEFTFALAGTTSRRLVEGSDARDWTVRLHPDCE